ncbi:MATE efflux family protein 6-like [Dorcoceras hygrometricum]|uniref:MATE efflux family protein 6-like n=1 Tax=Dorcoceras hygrometricum TaxID=472368 RepID=A0A2Z7DBM0_9LAMI|nr:MATE efflux family protein 6-like [Dorcoceras hygrometricum]
MASSFYSNSVHVDFESVLAMGEPGMVSMFQALVASGLQGFLGCLVVVYEYAPVEFFTNGTVRDGLVVSSVNGVVVEISEELFAETFDLPVVGLADVSEMPKDKIFDARSIVSLSGEPVILSGSKNQMKMHYRLLCDIMAKSISVKAGSFNAITVEKFSLMTAVVCDVRMNWGSVLFGIFKKMVTPGSKQAKGFAIQISLLLDSVPNLELGEPSEFPSSKILADKTIQRYIAIIKKVVNRNLLLHPKTSKRKSTLEMVAVAQEAVPIHMIETSTVAPAVEVPSEETRCSSADDVDVIIQQKSLDDILLSIPVDVPLPSAGMEITKIVMGQEIKIPGVTEKTWFLSSLPQIPVDHKGKAILVEKDPIIGNPAQEHFFLICADINLLVELRAKIIDEVAQFFHSFSLRKLATFNLEDMYKKEEQVLSWGETESPQEAIQWKLYILIKYREVLVRKFLESWRAHFVPGQGSTAVDLKVINLLTDLHLSILEELAKEARAHGLLWTKTCCSTIFEGSPGDRGAVISRTNTNTQSSCWIRMMILVDGVWTVEPCADKWVKIPRQIFSNEVHRQRQYDDTLPTVSEFLRLVRKKWADVCLEFVEFCASRRLLPIGSLQFCRSSSVVEPVFQVASRKSPVFAFRVSQFCSIFVDFSLFNWFPSADISDFLSSIALDRTALSSVQRSFAQTVVPSVQFSLDQRPSSPNTADSSSSLHFDTTDVDATVSSLPPVSQDFSAALADLQAILSEQIYESQSGISSKLHKIEQGFHTFLKRSAVALYISLKNAKRQRLDKLKRQRIDWLSISADGYSELQPADDVNQQAQAHIDSNTIVYSNGKDS